MLFVHGLESHALWFNSMAAEFGIRGMSSYAWNRAQNHPSSDRLISLRSDLDRIASFLQKKHSKVILVGNSWGGLLVLDQMTSSHTPWYKYIAIAPALFSYKAFSWKKLLRAGARRLSNNGGSYIPVEIDTSKFSSDPNIQEYIRNDPLRRQTVSIDLLLSTFLLRWAVRRRLSSLSVEKKSRCLIMAAEKDKIIATKTLLKFCKSSQIEFVHFANCEHTLIMEAPEALVSCIMDERTSLK